jgi:hypothetical protein
MMKKFTVALFLCVASVSLMGAVTNPSYFSSLIIGGGHQSEPDGGMTIEDNGDMQTDGTIIAESIEVTTLDAEHIEVSGTLQVGGASKFSDPLVLVNNLDDDNELLRLTESPLVPGGGTVIAKDGAFISFDDPAAPTIGAAFGNIGFGYGFGVLDTDDGPSSFDIFDPATVTRTLAISSEDADSTLTISNSEDDYVANVNVEGVITAADGYVEIGSGPYSMPGLLEGRGLRIGGDTHFLDLFVGEDLNKSAGIQYSGSLYLRSEQAERYIVITGNDISYSGADSMQIRSVGGNKQVEINDSVVAQGASNTPLILRRAIKTNGSLVRTNIQAQNSADAYVTYGAVVGEIVSNTAGSETGAIRFNVRVSGTETERLRATANGIRITGAPTYADNAAAIAGGLSAGDVYRTSTGVLMIRY